MVRPLSAGRTSSATRSRDGHKAQQPLDDPKRPGSGLLVRATPCGVAFHQHHLYTASALAVIVPPAALAARSGSRDSLCVGMPTSPLRNRERPGRGTVATPRDICTTGAADRQPEQLKKKTAVLMGQNDCRVLWYL